MNSLTANYLILRWYEFGRTLRICRSTFSRNFLATLHLRVLNLVSITVDFAVWAERSTIILFSVRWCSLHPSTIRWTFCVIKSTVWNLLFRCCSWPHSLIFILNNLFRTMNIKLLFNFSLFILIMANRTSNYITNLQTIIQLVIIMGYRTICILLSVLSLTVVLPRKLSTVKLSIHTQMSIFSAFLSWGTFKITSLCTLRR